MFNDKTDYSIDQKLDKLINVVQCHNDCLKELTLIIKELILTIEKER